MPVLPVTKMRSSGIPSRTRFWRLVVVGARWKAAIREISWRFSSSGNGVSVEPVRSPASTWPTGMRRLKEAERGGGRRRRVAVDERAGREAALAHLRHASRPPRPVALKRSRQNASSRVDHRRDELVQRQARVADLEVDVGLIPPARGSGATRSRCWPVVTTTGANHVLRSQREHDREHLDRLRTRPQDDQNVAARLSGSPRHGAANSSRSALRRPGGAAAGRRHSGYGGGACPISSGSSYQRLRSPTLARLRQRSDFGSASTRSHSARQPLVDSACARPRRGRSAEALARVVSTVPRLVRQRPQSEASAFAMYGGVDGSSSLSPTSCSSRIAQMSLEVLLRWLDDLQLRQQQLGQRHASARRRCSRSPTAIDVAHRELRRRRRRPGGRGRGRRRPAASPPDMALKRSFGS